MTENSDPRHADERLAKAGGSVRTARIVLSGGTVAVECIPVGWPDATHLVAVCEDLVQNGQYAPDVPVLWNFSGFDFAPYDPAICRKQVFFLERFPQRKGVKRACLVDSELGYGHMRMFQELVGGFGIDDMNSIHVSYSRDELIDWLDS